MQGRSRIDCSLVEGCSFSLYAVMRTLLYLLLAVHQVLAAEEHYLRDHTLYGQLDAQLPAAAEKLLAAPTVHGWVQKSGSLGMQLWHPMYYHQRSQTFNKWLLNNRFSHEATRTRNQAVARGEGLPLPDSPPIIFPGCHVYANHRYKFLYIRHPKTASTSVLTYFTECAPADRPQSESRPFCVSRLREPLTPNAAAALFSDYFVFSVVRSPRARLLSAFRFLVDRLPAGRRHCRQVVAAASSWDAFCADPLSLGAACHIRPECCLLPSGYYWHHTVEQGRCLVAGDAETGGDEGGGVGWAVDFIARQEHFEEDMAEVFAEIDRRRAPGLPPVSSGRLVWGNVSPSFPGCPVPEHGGAGTAAVWVTDGEEHEEGGGRVGGGQAAVWVNGRRMVYNASLPVEQYCQLERYYEGQHAHCVVAADHFFAEDIHLLYGEQGGSKVAGGEPEGEQGRSEGGENGTLAIRRGASDAVEGGGAVESQ